MRVPAELAGEPLLDLLRATPATEYLVVEETGEIYGVLSTADVEKRLRRRHGPARLLAPARHRPGSARTRLRRTRMRPGGRPARPPRPDRRQTERP